MLSAKHIIGQTKGGGKDGMEMTVTKYWENYEQDFIKAQPLQFTIMFGTGKLFSLSAVIFQFINGKPRCESDHVTRLTTRPTPLPWEYSNWLKCRTESSVSQICKW